MVGLCKQNRSGKFLELLVTKNGNNRSENPIMIPARKNKDFWSLMGAKILGILNTAAWSGGNINSANRQNFSHGGRMYLPSTCREGLTWPKQTRGAAAATIVKIWNYSDLSQNSWWRSSVVAKSNTNMVDWTWVRRKIDSAFKNVGLRIKSGVALVTLESEEAAKQIVGMTSPSEWGIIVTFERWSPKAGTLMERELNPTVCKLKFWGTPIHLRTEMVARKIMESFSKSFTIDTETINFANTWMGVTISGTKREEIPRVIILEEREEKFQLKLTMVEEMEELGRAQGERQLFSTVVGCTTSSSAQISGVRFGGDEGNRCNMVVSDSSCVPETASSQRDTCPPRNKDKSLGALDQWRRVVEGITRGSPTQNRGNQAQVHAAEITQSNRFHALQESDMRSPAHAQCSPRPQSPIQPQIQAQVQNTTQNPNVPLDPERSSQSIYHSQATPSRSNSGPNLNLGWGHSLVLSKRFLGPTVSHSRKRKPRNGRNRNLAVQALNQLQETEQMGTHVQQVSILQRNDPLPSLNQPTLVENSTPAVSFSEASNDRFFHENCRIGRGELENSSSTSNSCPPGFGEANYNLESADLMSRVLDDCCKVRSGSKLNKWISTVVRDLASKMGVTSIHGKAAIEKFYFELGTRHLKAKRVAELNEDEQERLGYANSNDVLRELNLT
ncbi:hypothetical protein FRX31_011737 [Thalictrum thalictroides]|uniref:DUF4283 domain-containing protein n=1 Tax=Thalictrum thalictroides TaxID=46969 RepID=A0A7J6WRE1_THATH|nr:hypothetical protein FRX31_011737 [Thalictrum thalictroides]